MTHDIDEDRAEFDAWWEEHGLGGYESQFEAWQAARRAPAAPVPQGWKPVPVEPTKEMVQRACDDHGYPGGSRWVYRAGYRSMLAAAPQPPEAAPVELPEYGIDTANHAGIRVRGYTEQQVRELLAAQGIKVVP
jgi:hypothetical protein